MIVNKTTGDPSEFPCTVYTEAVKDPSLETHVITSFAIIYTMQVLLKVWQPKSECNDRYIFLQRISTHFIISKQPESQILVKILKVSVRPRSHRQSSSYLSDLSKFPTTNRPKSIHPESGAVGLDRVHRFPANHPHHFDLQELVFRRHHVPRSALDTGENGGNSRIISML